MSIQKDRLDNFFKLAEKNTGGQVSCDSINDNVLLYFFMSMLSLIQRAALATGMGDLIPIKTALETLLVRKFLKNSTGADVYIKQSGVLYTIANGSTYAMSEETMKFFIGKAAEVGVTLTEVDLTEYLSTGEPDTFI